MRQDTPPLYLPAQEAEPHSPGASRFGLMQQAWLWLPAIALLGALCFQVSQQRLIPLEGAPSTSDIEQIGLAIRFVEPGFRRRALERFPGDPWSQGDAFSNRERQFVRRQARIRNLRVGAVLEAIDRDVRAHPGDARGEVPPCMPRPYYL